MFFTLFFTTAFSFFSSIKENTSEWFLDNIEMTTENSFVFPENSMAIWEKGTQKKKFMIELNGTFADSYLIFSKSLDFENMETSDTSVNLHIQYKPQLKKYSFELTNKGQVTATKQAFFKPGLEESFAFSVVSGRGYFGVFSLPHIDGKEPLILVPMTIDRNHKLVFYSKEPSTIENLAVMDFLHHSPKFDFDNNWDSHLNDLL